MVYFPNDPKDKDSTEASNHWVYWFKPEKKDGVVVGTCWGRCPTPKHPNYKQMQKDARGPDLWQLIPEGSRKPDANVGDLKGSFGPTISTADKKLPKIAKGQEPTITCIDFTNPLFN